MVNFAAIVWLGEFCCFLADWSVMCWSCFNTVQRSRCVSDVFFLFLFLLIHMSSVALWGDFVLTCAMRCVLWWILFYLRVNKTIKGILFLCFFSACFHCLFVHLSHLFWPLFSVSYLLGFLFVWFFFCLCLSLSQPAFIHQQWWKWPHASLQYHSGAL